MSKRTGFLLLVLVGCGGRASETEPWLEPATSALVQPGPRPVEGTVLLANRTYALSGVRFNTPAQPGFYTWKSLAGVAPPGARPLQNVLVVAPVATGYVCSELAQQGPKSDATELLQRCIDATPAGTALELPPGNYAVSSNLHVDRSITVRTQGIAEDRGRCGTGAFACARLFATPEFNESGGFVTSTAPNAGVVLDHLIIDGNRAARLETLAAEQCRHGYNQFGVNADIRSCAGCRVTNSVFQNALCGTGLHVWDVDVVSSLFANNGVHTAGEIDLLWSDGLTVGLCEGKHVVNNEFLDNTDVDLIFGSGQGCIGQDNRIRHSGKPSQGAFIALSLFTWYTTGFYFRSDFSFNDVDCAGQCGKGLALGSDDAMGPYFTFIEGGSVHDNRITRAQQGVAVDAARNVEFYDNLVTESGGLHSTSCGSFELGSYDVSPESLLDRSRDTVPSNAYASRQWDWCTPNWPIALPQVRTLYGEFDGQAGSETLEIHPGDAGWFVSHESEPWLYGLSSGDLHLVGDFDADGHDDVLIYVDGEYFWHAALANGASFTPVPYALSGEPLGPGACALDVDNDGADEIVNPASGRCADYDEVARHFVTSNCPFSCDTPFNPNAHPATTSRLLYGSFNDDLPHFDRRDALTIEPSTLTWHVKTGRSPWLHHYEDWQHTVVADFDGDGREDVLLVPAGQPRWDVAQSTGDRFWLRQGALSGYGPFEILCARNLDQDPAAEVILHAAPTNLCAKFANATGTFSVSPCSASCFVH